MGIAETYRTEMGEYKKLWMRSGLPVYQLVNHDIKEEEEEKRRPWFLHFVDQCKCWTIGYDLLQVGNIKSGEQDIPLTNIPKHGWLYKKVKISECKYFCEYTVTKNSIFHSDPNFTVLYSI